MGMGMGQSDVDVLWYVVQEGGRARCRKLFERVREAVTDFGNWISLPFFIFFSDFLPRTPRAICVKYTGSDLDRDLVAKLIATAP